MITKIVGKHAPPLGETPAVLLVNPKHSRNVAASVRAASCFGAKQVWYTGQRFSFDEGERLPREERMKAYDEINLFNCDVPFDAFPAGTVPVAVEVRDSSENLAMFPHPENALYVFGPEDGGLQKPWVNHCHRFVIIPTAHCVNLAAAVYLVLYSRRIWRWQQGLQDLPTMQEHRGFIDDENPIG